MATAVWQGGAPAVAEVQTIAVDGTWADADTATVTVNGKAVTYTMADLGAVNTQLYVNAKLTAALNASTLPEFEEMTAVNTSNTVMTITADTAGRPWTATVASTTAGDGALGSPSVTTAATGPNVWDTAANWDGGAAPVAGDTVIFEHSDVDALYNLDQSSVDNLAVMTVKQSYTGKLGLPRTNVQGGSAAADKYVEYRTQSLTVQIKALTIGKGSGSGSGRLKFSMENGTACAIRVLDTGTPIETDVESVIITNTHADTTAVLSKGSVGFNIFAGETGSLSTLDIGFRQNQIGCVTGKSGSGTTLTTLTKSGGIYEVQAAVTTITHTGGTLTFSGTGAVTTLNARGGMVKYLSDGTLTNLLADGGATVDYSQDMRSRTVSNGDVWKGATMLDPHKTVTWSAGIDLNQCGLIDVTLDLGEDFTLTPSAV